MRRGMTRKEVEAYKEQCVTEYDLIQTAISELVSGQAVASYSLGNRSFSFSRVDLGKLQDRLEYLDREIGCAINALLGRPLNNTTTCVATRPTNVIPWR